MLTITKRSGLEVEFHTGKIANSMMNAGISQETAQKVADSILYHEGITTLEVRNRVIGGIKNREPQAAKQFESYPKKAHKTYYDTHLD
ncbi:MAG: hypothetical protein CVT49_12960 [candidate division Zixibacteria bacterium HGW-Zixibacteria-1]|nr:MAG: hypothetical protein CVT49_12960 [candidate division Zixibacteria bacterium HGW-Zixibacteria-1]